MAGGSVVGIDSAPHEGTFFVSLLLRPQCWLHQAGRKMTSNSRHHISTLDHSFQKRKKNLTVQGDFQKPLKRPFVITHCPAVGHIPIPEPAPGTWRETQGPARKD